jgi:uncharacterized coiled-coil protein SlyX
MPQEEQEEYEIIPVSPLRKLEKKVEQLEASTSVTNAKDIFKEVVDVMRMNQQIIDDLSKANDALRIELSKLTVKLEELAGSLKELLSYIKASAEEEYSQPQDADQVVGKLNELVEANKKVVESNQALLNALGDMDRKMRRPLLPIQRKPL